MAIVNARKQRRAREHAPAGAGPRVSPMRSGRLPSIIIAGASHHAKVVMDVVERQGRYRIAGLIDSSRRAGGDWFGYPILGTEHDLPVFTKAHRVVGFVVAVGDNWVRHLFARRISEIAPGLSEVTAVHPSAQVARGVEIGAGSVVMAGAVINSDSRVGRGCIVNTRASLDHDGVMDDFASLGPGATLGGKVVVGAFSVVALGAGVIHGRRIGKHALVGAGAVVIDDVPDFTVFYGVPARRIRNRREGERYL